jgi:hypothetical protein
MNRKKIILLGFVGLVVLSAALVFFRSDAASRRAAQFSKGMTSAGLAVAVGSEGRGENGVKEWRDVLIEVPAFPVPMPVRAEKIRFTGDGDVLAERVRFEPPKGGSGVTMLLSRLGAQDVRQDGAGGMWLAATFVAAGADFSEERRLQMLLLPLQALLFTQPKAAQELPGQLLGALRDGDVTFRYDYNEAEKTLKLDSQITLPNFTVISLRQQAAGIQRAEFNSCYNAAVSALKNPQSDVGAQVAPRCSAAMAKATPAVIELKIVEQGAREKLFALYGVALRQRPEDAQAGLLQRISSTPIPAPRGITPDAQDVHVAETIRRALLDVIGGARNEATLTLSTKPGVTVGQAQRAVQQGYGYGALLNIKNQ